MINCLTVGLDRGCIPMGNDIKNPIGVNICPIGCI